jgi:type IX secretion system PorP/SprF family membrane protein
MRMRKKLLLLLLLLAHATLFAQKLPQYSLYMVNNYLLNPAISGIEDYADIKTGYRNQWISVEGAPVTYYLSAHAPLGKNINLASPVAGSSKRRPAFAAYQKQNNKYRKVRPHHGIGGIIQVDRIGPFSLTEAYVTYAYHVLLTEGIKLSMGLAAGGMQYVFRGSDLVLANPNDNAVGNQQFFKPDLSAGLWLYADDFYLGVASSHLLGNASFNDDLFGEKNTFSRHYFFTGAYKITPTTKLALIPSIMVKTTASVPVSVDYNLRATYADALWGGVSYRQGDAFTFLVGVTANHTFDFGYAYDTGVSSLGEVSAGSHEFILGIRLRNRFKVHCPQNMW